MLGKLQENERDLFRTRLEDLINPNHETILTNARYYQTLVNVNAATY